MSSAGGGEGSSAGGQSVSAAKPAPGAGKNANNSDAARTALDAHGHGKEGFWTLALGSVGVVFGDIGTSPLYAMREALHHAKGEIGDFQVIGVVSLVLWALFLVVTVKYVLFIMRADNKGEGGTLVLMTLAQRALRTHSTPVLVLGVIGAALFYGDGVVTPAMSVMGALEGLKVAPGVGNSLDPYVLPMAVIILIGLFMVQPFGTGKVAKFFGPITVVWFLTLGGLGLLHIADDARILNAFNPYYAAAFLVENGVIGFIILGSVFLAVTGAEALYADMGHFGRGPIRAAWMVLVLPCLALNYLGQGALVLSDPEAIANPFYRMAPDFLFWPVLILATMAAVIASQAVITGAFSLTQQAVQLGLLPRLTIRRTSETQAGQIFVPQVNNLLLVGVLLLVGMFQNSSNLAAAYGIAVTGSMAVDTALAFVVVHYMWKWSRLATFALIIPFMIIDLIFFGANALKLLHGAWAPLTLGAAIVAVMLTWRRGSLILLDKTRRESVSLEDLIAGLKAKPPHKVPGTAIFLTGDPDIAPLALMHNLKHNKVLHENNILLTVKTESVPRVLQDRVEILPAGDGFQKLIVHFGFMEEPNVPQALGTARKQGLKFDIMSTSFFLGHRTILASPNSGMPMWQDRIFVMTSRGAANATEFFHLPSGRVVELGAQVTV
ncbi:MAG: potassium transporter Kup [Caulobacterales bacterium]